MSWALNDPHLLDAVNMKDKVYNNFVTQFFLVLASIGLKSVVDYLNLQKKAGGSSKAKAGSRTQLFKIADQSSLPV